MNTKVLPVSDYRDPAQIFEERQASTCKGCSCANVKVIPILNRQYLATFCKLHPKKKPMRGDGKRCEDYHEGSRR